jgi:putative flippase GtrA
MIYRQIGWFSVAGVVGFGIDAGILYLLLACGLGPYVSRLFSFLSAVYVTWLINSRLTFADRPGESLRRGGMRYFVAMAMGGLINYGVYSAFITTGWAPVFGLIAGTGAGMACNFLSARYWVFRNRTNQRADGRRRPASKGTSPSP